MDVSVARKNVSLFSAHCAGWTIKALSLLTLFLCLGCAPTLERSDSAILAAALLEAGNAYYESSALDAAQMLNYYQMQQVINQLNQNVLLQQQNQILIRHNMGLRY